MGLFSRKVDLEERLQWLKESMPLYNDALPIIHGIAQFDPELKSKERLESAIKSLLQGYEVLPVILEVAKKLPKPKDYAVSNLRKEFINALNMAINACEGEARYERRRSKVILSQIVFYTGMTRGSLEDITKIIDVLFFVFFKRYGCSKILTCFSGW